MQKTQGEMSDNFKITLASNSKRRHELLAGLDVKFTIEPNKDEKEIYASDLEWDKVPEFLAKHKSETFHRPLEDNEILITADTLVFLPDPISGKTIILGKPENRNDAQRILNLLSGKTHKVLTGVVLRSNWNSKAFTVSSDVTFRKLKNSEINYYLDNYEPYDKAGAYGVQEWIGYIAISSISGSYYNVMGLPVQQLYSELEIIKNSKKTN